MTPQRNRTNVETLTFSIKEKEMLEILKEKLCSMQSIVYDSHYMTAEISFEDTGRGCINPGKMLTQFRLTIDYEKKAALEAELST